MNYIGGFFDQNWALVLLTVALLILLNTNVHVRKSNKKWMYAVVFTAFFLGVASYIEVLLGEGDVYSVWRSILSCFKYAVPPLILAMISCIVLNEVKWQMFIPAALNGLVVFLSLATKWVFAIDKENSWSRGPLGYVPFIIDGLYLFYLIWKLFLSGNKYAEDIVPLAFLAATGVLCIVMPIVWGGDFEKWFCTTIMIDVFVYYVFMLQQLSKKDALTGLLNRQSYYADIENYKNDITAVVSLDMNGLKTMNDTYGHDAGDKALVTLANCFVKAVRLGQRVYRVGGDEFMILCIRSGGKDVEKLVSRIRDNVEETEYYCSVGRSVREHGESFEELVKRADEQMYDEKARYYLLLKSEQ